MQSHVGVVLGELQPVGRPHKNSLTSSGRDFMLEKGQKVRKKEWQRCSFTD